MKINAQDDMDMLQSKLQQALNAASQRALQQLEKDFENILQQCEQHFLQSARQFKADADKESLIHAIHECQANRALLHKTFNQQLNQQFQSLSTDAIAHKTATTKAGLIEKADINEKIIMQKITADAARHFQQLLSRIINALNQCFGPNSFDAKNNPFGPHAISTAFYLATQNLDIDSLARQEFFKLFQSQCFFKLKAFYQELAEALEQCSSISESQTVQHSSSSFKLDTVATETAEVEHKTYSVQPQQQSQWDVTLLLQEQIIPSYFDASDYQCMKHLNPEASDLSRKALLELLANAQKGYDPNSDGELIDFIKRQISLEKQFQQDIALSLEDENIVNFISLIFNFIATNEQSQYQEFFYRLKIPYTRIALSDDLFFHDRHHPARRLLDEIFNLMHQQQNKALQRQIQHCFSKIILRFNGSLAIFEDLLKGFENVDDEQQEGIDIGQIKTAEQQYLQQQAALEAAKALIQKHHHHLEQELPFHQLSNALWRNMLVAIALQHGQGSPQWHEAENLFTTLLNISGFANSATLKAQLKTLPATTAAIKQLLAAQHINEELQQLFFEQLQSLQILLLRGNALTQISADSLPQHQQLETLLQRSNHLQNSENNRQQIGHEHQAPEQAIVAKVQRPSPEQAKEQVAALSLGQKLYYRVDAKTAVCVVGFYASATRSYAIFDEHNKLLFNRSGDDMIQDFCNGYAQLLINNRSFNHVLDGVCARIEAHAAA